MQPQHNTTTGQQQQCQMRDGWVEKKVLVKIG